MITGVVIQVSAVRWRVVTFVIILSCILVILRATAPVLMRIAGVVLLTVATVHNADNSFDCHLGRYMATLSFRPIALEKSIKSKGCWFALKWF